MEFFLPAAYKQDLDMKLWDSRIRNTCMLDLSII